MGVSISASRKPRGDRAHSACASHSGHERPDPPGSPLFCPIFSRNPRQLLRRGKRRRRERLPSGKFDTNDAVLSLAVLAYNSLRLIGQHCLLGKDAPVRHPGKRRRLRTVMQEIMYLAVSVAEHARLMVLGLVHHASAYAAFKRLVEGWRIRLA